MDTSLRDPIRPKQRLLGVLLFLLAMALGGSTVPVSKRCLVDAPVFLTTFLTLATALVAMAPLQWRHRRELRSIDRKALSNMALQAVFGIVLFRLFSLYGLRLTGGGQASVLTGTTPAVMAILSVAFLGERPGRRTLLGICFAIGGIVCVKAGALPDEGTLDLVGTALILCAVVSEALLTIFRKAVASRVSAVTNTTVLAAVAALLTAPVAAVEWATTPWAGQPEYLLGIFYYGWVATALGYLCFMGGTSRISASTAGVLSAALPAAATGLSAVLLNEQFGMGHWAGCALVAAGIVATASDRSGQARTSALVPLKGKQLTRVIPREIEEQPATAP